MKFPGMMTSRFFKDHKYQSVMLPMDKMCPKCADKEDDKASSMQNSNSFLHCTLGRLNLTKSPATKEQFLFVRTLVVDLSGRDQRRCKTLAKNTPKLKVYFGNFSLKGHYKLLLKCFNLSLSSGVITCSPPPEIYVFAHDVKVGDELYFLA